MESGSLPTMPMRILRPILAVTRMEMLGMIPITLKMTQVTVLKSMSSSSLVADPWGQPGKSGMMPTDSDDDLIV